MADTRTELALEVTGASMANKAMTAGAATGVLGWAAQVNWIGLAGVLVAVFGLLTNIYFQHRREKREEMDSAAREARKAELHEAQLAALRERCDI